MQFAADWRTNVDFGRLRRDRIRKVERAMDEHGLGALLVFRPENTRYLCSLRPLWMPTWLFLNAAAFVPGHEPILWVMTDDYPHRAAVIDWLPPEHIRPFPGAIEDSADASATLDALIGGLGDLRVTTGRLGVDIVGVNVLDQLRSRLPDIDVVDGEWPMRTARRTKTPDEIELMRQGCAAVDAAFEVVFDTVRPGMRETEVLAAAYHELYRFGSEVPQSAGIVASGPHSSPMARMATDRVMQNGDLVWVDVGGCFNGIFCEASRAVIVGSPSRRQVEIHDACYRAQQAVFALLRPGVHARELQAAAQAQLDPVGLTQYLQKGPLLHGIGVGSAEPPWIPGPGHQYDLVLEEGMTLSVVPTLQVPGVPGGGGVRLEDQIAVGANGVDRLTRARYDKTLLSDRTAETYL